VSDELTAQAAEILQRPYRWELIPWTEPPNVGWSASIVEFPGCLAEGATASEAIDNLRKAAEDWLWCVLNAGQSVPEPSWDAPTDE